MLPLCALLSAAACDSLLDVEAPSRIPAETLEDPATAGLLLNVARRAVTTPRKAVRKPVTMSDKRLITRTVR